MFPHLLRLLLAMAVVCFGQSRTVVAVEPMVKMECCETQSSASCPECPKAPMKARSCCCVVAVVLFASAVPVFVFSSDPTRYAVAVDGFPARADRPPVPPPRAA